MGNNPKDSSGVLINPSEGAENVEQAQKTASTAGDPSKTNSQPEKEYSDSELQPEIERLRQLLFQRELRQIYNLEQRLSDPALHAKDISKVIAEAILLRVQKDDRLAKALQPTVETIFRASVKSNPAELATSLFPLMGPAIRKAITEGFRSMLEGFNKTLEMSFSLRGLQWRFEALRTGKPFSEVVLLHTLVYQVEQVFLIHSHTGLMLGHVIAEGVEHKDGDLVAGMLTAIQDFVKDCFAIGDESLDTLQMGDRSLLVEKGPEASLALVVRGTLPVSFKDKIRDILDLIHIEGADAFAHFKGDMEPFVPLQRYLDDCLVQRYVTDDDKILPFWVKCLPVAVLLLCVGLPGFLLYQSHRFHRAVGLLEEVPGIVVSGTRGGFIAGWEVSLARDPLAQNPADVLQKAGLNTDRIVFFETPFASLEPELVTSRLKRAMDAPESVSLEFIDGVLHLKGSAPLNWILATTEKALAIPGVERVDTRNISDPRTAQLTALIRQVEQTRVEFPLGRDTPEGEELVKLHHVVESLSGLSDLAVKMGLSATLIIYGHTDTSGTDKRNYELSEARAKTLASMLYSRGVAMPIATYGFGSQYVPADLEASAVTKEIDQRSRRLELKVHLSYLGNSLVTFEGQ